MSTTITKLSLPYVAAPRDGGSVSTTITKLSLPYVAAPRGRGFKV